MKFIVGLILSAALIFAQAAAATGTHSIALSWPASSTAGATYNVYMAPGACPAANPLAVTPNATFIKQNGAAITALTYGISGLPATTTYCVLVSAVSAGVESCTAGLANQTTACPNGNPLATAATPADSAGPFAVTSIVITIK